MSKVQHPPLVEALLRTEAYAEEVAAVELLETHISYLFLTGKHVFKVKKPVDYGFLDFTTQDKRRYYCQREVELNRRIAPEVYLGVVEVNQSGESFTIEGPGQTVDYAVKMVQLPQDRAMTFLLKQGQVTEAHIRHLASKIVGFHREAATGPEITRLGDWDAVYQNIEENFQQTERFVGVSTPPETYDDLHAYSRAFLDQNKDLFRRRAEEGRIKDCHGDLHTAQIFLENGISIIDCIEFNDRFRYSDVAEDIAFLAMDLDFHHRPDYSQLLIQTYLEESGDDGVLELLDFFKCYRAYVRGKVTSFRLDDASLPEEERQQVIDTAQAYFQLAHSYAPVLSRPSLVIMAGLTGTGKSTLAEALARRWSLAYISSDVTRKELSGVSLAEHRYEDFGQGIYSSEMSRRTYDAMFAKAEGLLEAGQVVVLDGTFRSADERYRAIQLAKEHNVDLWLVECKLPDEVARRRLIQRTAEGGAVSDGRWEIYQQQQQEWESVKDVPEGRHLVLDTSGTVVANINQLLYLLYSILV